MAKIFELVPPENEGDEPTYREVDLNKIELPEEHPLVRTAEVRKEDLNKFRRLYREEKAKAEALEAARQAPDDEGSDEPTPEPAEPTNNTVQFDPEKLYAEFATRFQKDMEETQKKNKEKSQKVAQVMEEYKLPAQLKDVLGMVADDEEKLKTAAQTIAGSGFRFEDVPGGSGGDTPDLDVTKVYKNLGIADPD